MTPVMTARLRWKPSIHAGFSIVEDKTRPNYAPNAWGCVFIKRERELFLLSTML